MYHKESTVINNAFEQQIQVNVETTQLEDVFKHNALLLCAELWFAEETESDVSNDKLQLISSRQMRVHLSPTRGLSHHFLVFFDYTHLCAVDFVIYGYLTSILPGLSRSPSLPSNFQSLIAYEDHAKQTWRDVLLGSLLSNVNKRHFAIAIHRHLCQALLSARERMLILWHEIAIFLKNQFQPTSEIADLRGLLEGITSNFQLITSENEMEATIARDIEALNGENSMMFRQICEFAFSTSKVAKHLQRKSHQVRMKRMAESFFVQELQIPQLLAVYEPSTTGHEAMASAVRQSQYFQQLPELPVSCRELDGDPSNIPIVFEDVYVPLTEAQRNGVVQSTLDAIVPVSSSKPSRRIQKEEGIRTDFNHRPAYRPASVVAGSTSSVEDTILADLAVSRSGSYKSLVFGRSHCLVPSESRRNRFNLGRRVSTRSDVAIAGGRSDVRLLSYRRITDDSPERNGISRSTTSKSQDCDDVDDEKGHWRAGSGNASRFSKFGEACGQSVSLLSLPSLDVTSPVPLPKFHLLLRLKHNRNQRQMKHALSTPNLDVAAAAASSEAPLNLRSFSVALEAVGRCPRCGLPDWGGADRPTDTAAAAAPYSLSMPSLTSLDPGGGSCSLSDPGVSNSLPVRPSMRRLKQQKRQQQMAKSLFGRSSKSRCE
uniref:Protein unc-80 n=1 Tax=Mesocestoides corti TaxID=53468 RepID=A0A5K3EZN6_MESCO